MFVKENLVLALSAVITIWLIDLNTWTVNTGQNSLGDQNINLTMLSDLASEMQKGKRMIDAGELRQKYKIKMWLYHVNFIIKIILFRNMLMSQII